MGPKISCFTKKLCHDNSILYKKDFSLTMIGGGVDYFMVRRFQLWKILPAPFDEQRISSTPVSVRLGRVLYKRHVYFWNNI